MCCTLKKFRTLRDEECSRITEPKKKKSEIFLWGTYFKFIWYVSYIHWTNYMQLMAKLACGGLWKRGTCDQGTWPDHRKVCPGGKTHKDTKIWEEQRFVGRSFYSWKPVFNIWWHFWNPSVHVNIAFQHIFFKSLEPSNNVQ